MSLQFEAVRSHHETRMEQLEEEVLDLCRLLNKMKKQRQSQEQFINYVQTETHFLWQFDMREFRVENINLELKKRRIKLEACRKQRGQFLIVYRKFELPANAGTDLIAKMEPTGLLTIQAPLTAD